MSSEDRTKDIPKASILGAQSVRVSIPLSRLIPKDGSSPSPVVAEILKRASELQKIKDAEAASLNTIPQKRTQEQQEIETDKAAKQLKTQHK